MEAQQAMYYHVNDPIHNLKLKATLRQVKGKRSDVEQTGTHSREFSWQQKCFSPRELYKYTSSRSKGHGVTPLETEYREQIRGVERPQLLLL